MASFEPLEPHLLRACKLLFTDCENYLWDCRRNQTLSNIVGFRAKIQLKYETKAYIARKINHDNKIFIIEMGELYSVILLLVSPLFYVYKMRILFFGHFNDYFL